MKANELRIGNHLNHQRYGKVILEIQDFNDWNFDEVDPIPLTEEWLLKFGFQIVCEGIRKEYCIKGWIYLDKEKHTDYFGYDSDRTKIKYVHQLQNLVYALTGEEL